MKIYITEGNNFILMNEGNLTSHYQDEEMELNAVNKALDKLQEYSLQLEMMKREKEKPFVKTLGVHPLMRKRKN